nr:unnamed protein product [Callosobruchus chinensis]
MVEIRQGVDSG